MLRTLLTAALILLAAGCGSSSAPVVNPNVRQVLESHLAILANGIVREDALLASQPISERFQMGNNVAVRYRNNEWEGRGIQRFRDYWDSVFDITENISITFEIEDDDLNGEVVTTIVNVEYSGVLTNRTPPESTTATGRDYLVWQLERDGWRLISWAEAPEGAHLQGEAGDI